MTTPTPTGPAPDNLNPPEWTGQGTDADFFVPAQTAFSKPDELAIAVERVTNIELSDGGGGYASAVMDVYASEPVNQLYADLRLILSRLASAQETIRADGEPAGQPIGSLRIVETEGGFGGPNWTWRYRVEQLFDGGRFLFWSWGSEWKAVTDGLTRADAHAYIARAGRYERVVETFAATGEPR